MPQFRTRRRVQAFRLRACSIWWRTSRSIPEFVPLCQALGCAALGGRGDRDVVADRVAYEVRETFVAARLDRPNLKIRGRIPRRPLQTLDNRWTFTPRPGCLQVEFFIAYELKSSVLGLLMGAMLKPRSAVRRGLRAPRRRGLWAGKHILTCARLGCASFRWALHDLARPDASVIVTSGRFALTLFAATLFSSAVLLFAVQPMFTKMVLPFLGGAPSVWSVAMVFFQAALLVGYGYAHLLARTLPVRQAALVHLGVLAAAALTLPIGMATVFGDPPSEWVGLWLIGAVRRLDRAAVRGAVGERAVAAKLVRRQRPHAGA